MDAQLIFVYALFCVIAGWMGHLRHTGFWRLFFYSIVLTPAATLVFLYFTSYRKA